MQINYQTNFNECGLCVIKSLFNYFYHKELPISQLLYDANLTQNGLSIYDFELIGQKNGLNFDSYEISFEEFKNLKTNKYFVLILNNENGLHYVIAKKKSSDKLTIFCSVNGEYDINYEELKKYWFNIYIEVNKTKQKINFCELNYSFINWKNIIFVNLIQIIILAITIFNSTFLDQLFNHVIKNNELSNLLFLVVLFTSTFLTKYLGNLFISLFCYKNTFTQFKYLHYKITKKLNNKYLSFYEKVDQNFLRNADQYIFNIASFYNMYLNTVISDIFLIFGICIYVSIFNFLFLFIFIGYILLIFVIELVNIFYYKKQIIFLEDKNNKYQNLWNHLIFQINKINYIRYQNDLTFQLKQEHINIRNLIFKNINFNNGISFFNFINQQLFFILLIVYCCNLITNQNSVNFAKLTIILNLFQMIEGSGRSIIGIVNKYNVLKYSQTIYKNILDVDNKPLTIGIIEIDKLEKINFNKYEIFNGTIITGVSGSGKTTMLYKINNMIKLNEDDNLTFNDINKSNINNLCFNNQFIYVNSQINLVNDEEINNLLINSQYKNEILEILQILKIKNITNCSLGQQQALLFISLLNCKNKIICLDEVLSNLDAKLKEILLLKIKPLIEKNNFLIYVSHDHNIYHFFNHRIELHV